MFAITKIYTDGSLDTFQWIRCVNLLGFRARWNKTKSARCIFTSLTPISSVIRSAPTVESQSLNIIMSLSVLRFLLTFFISAVSICGCFIVCRVFLRVTMTSSTQGTITGYLPRALIWIGNVFVYHTWKTVRITYKYVIKDIITYFVVICSVLLVQ